IIAVGGTIDALEYDTKTGSVISFAKPAAAEIVEKAMPGAASQDISVTSPFQKDSDVMTDQDREEVVALCKRSQVDRIVVTHGTGTMIETALLLAKHIDDKTIVLTGSLPYMHSPANAAFNLGNAVAAAQLQPPGVYIVTSGEIAALSAGKIEKV